MISDEKVKELIEYFKGQSALYEEESKDSVNYTDIERKSLETYKVAFEFVASCLEYHNQ